MKSIEEVYKKLARRGGESVAYDARFQEITALRGALKVEAFDDAVSLSEKRGNRWVNITHCHPESYDDIYKTVLYYLEGTDPGENIKRLKHERAISLLILCAVGIAIIVIAALIHGSSVETFASLEKTDTIIVQYDGISRPTVCKKT